MECSKSYVIDSLFPHLIEADSQTILALTALSPCIPRQCIYELGLAGCLDQSNACAEDCSVVNLRILQPTKFFLNRTHSSNVHALSNQSNVLFVEKPNAFVPKQTLKIQSNI